MDNFEGVCVVKWGKVVESGVNFNFFCNVSRIEIIVCHSFQENMSVK